MQRLSEWFSDIDEKKTGMITQRELIVALRRQPGVLAMFCNMAGGLEDTGEVKGQFESVAEAAGHARREEVRKIKEILRSVDSDGSGTMEWEEFVEFFRRAGLLLEYEEKKNKTRNRTTLCNTSEAMQALNNLQREQDEQK